MDRTACTEPQCLYSRAIPLLPLWTVRPVQSLSACTVQLYLYSPMGCTACTEPQCLYSRAIPLLPLWAVRPVRSLSACTRVPFTFTFTFNPEKKKQNISPIPEVQCVIYNRILFESRLGCRLCHPDNKKQQACSICRNIIHRGIGFLKNKLDTQRRTKFTCCLSLPTLTPWSRVLLEKLIIPRLIIQFLWAGIAQSV